MSTPRVIGQIRVSTPEQARDDRNGIARQADALQIVRQRHNVQIIRTVTIQESGRFIMDDPDFQDILRDLETGAADGVAVAEQSRIFRPTEWEDFAVLGYFKRHRKLIYTPTAVIDPCTPEGMLLLGVKGLIDGLELSTMSGRMLSARDSLRNAGFSGSSPVTIPHGVLYTRRKGQKGGDWSYDAAYGAKMREAFRLLIEDDAGYDRLGRLLDLSERGAKNALRNKIWIGWRRIEFESRSAPVRHVENPRMPMKPDEGPRRYRPKRPLAQPIEIKLPIEPLISQELWERAQRIMEARKGHYKERKNPPDTLVAGSAIRCECGSGHYVKTAKRGSKKHSYFYCISRHPASKHRAKKYRDQPRPEPCTALSFRKEDFEAALERVMTSTLSAGMLLGVLESLQKANRRAPAKIRDIDEQLANLDKARKKGYREFSFGKVTQEDWDELRRDIEARRAELLASRPEVLPALFDAKTLARDIAAVFAEYALLSRPQKRVLLRRAFRVVQLNHKAEIIMLKLSSGFLGEREGVAKSRRHSRVTRCRPRAFRRRKPSKLCYKPPNPPR